MSQKRGAKGGWYVEASNPKKRAGWPYLFAQTSIDRLTLDTERIARQAEADQARKKRGSWA
jgi:hypothetical protein